MPPRIEWDFGQVPPDLYSTAIVYEYARESEPLRKSICAWFQVPSDGKTRAEKLVEALKKKDGYDFGEIFYPALNDLQKATHHNSQLWSFIGSCPLFPAPFLNCGLPAIKMAGQPEYDQFKSKFLRSRVSIMPISHWVKPEWCTENCWHSLEADRYALMVSV